MMYVISLIDAPLFIEIEIEDGDGAAEQDKEPEVDYVEVVDIMIGDYLLFSIIKYLAIFAKLIKILKIKRLI